MKDAIGAFSDACDREIWRSDQYLFTKEFREDINERLEEIRTSRKLAFGSLKLKTNY